MTERHDPCRTRNGKPIVRWGRKAEGLTRSEGGADKAAKLPKGWTGPKSKLGIRASSEARIIFFLFQISSCASTIHTLAFLVHLLPPSNADHILAAIHWLRAMVFSFHSAEQFGLSSVAHLWNLRIDDPGEWPGPFPAR